MKILIIIQPHLSDRCMEKRKTPAFLLLKYKKKIVPESWSDRLVIIIIIMNTR